MKFCQEIASQKTHLSLQNSLQRLLPDMFEFQQVSLLYKSVAESKEDQLCFLKDYTKSDLQENKGYSDEIVRIPIDIGLTGKAIKEGQMIASDKGSYDPRFRFESDNPLDITHIRNLIMMPLYVLSQGQRQLMGVLQLYNRNRTDLIHELDKDLLLAVASIVGTVIETSDELHRGFMVIYDMKQQLD